MSSAASNNSPASAPTPAGSNANDDSDTPGSIELNDKELKDLAKLLEGTDSSESGSNVAALLKQLDTSDNIADDLESKLDGILSKLDELMGVMDDPTALEEILGIETTAKKPESLDDLS